MVSKNGERTMRVKCAGIVVYPPGTRFGPRKSKDYEFLWIIEGGGTIWYDQSEIAVGPGMILLCRPGMTDRYDWGTQQRTVHAFSHFDMKTLPAGLPGMESWPLAQQMPPDDLLRPLFRYVLGMDTLPEPLRSKLIPHAMELILRAFVLGKFRVSPEPHGELPAVVEKALRLICQSVSQENPATITLPQLARSVHVSPGHLCRVFRQTLNMTPLKCVALVRLERAAMLLARTNLPVNQIAETTGFSRPYYFSAAFRKAYRSSPRAYRQAVREGAAPELNSAVRFLPTDLLPKFT